MKALGLLLGAISAFLSVISNLASAGAIVIDDFNDGIDPAWAQTNHNSTGWDYEITAGSGKQLRVNNIYDVLNDGKWGERKLRYVFGDHHGFSSLTDFVLKYYFSYESKDSSGANRLEVMQSIQFRLFDASNNTIASSKYVDAWVGDKGARSFIVGSSSFTSDPGTMPWQQAYNVSITRDFSGFTKISWSNDTFSWSGNTSEELAGVEIIFGHYFYLQEPVFSFMDHITIDNVTLSGSRVVAPGISPLEPRLNGLAYYDPNLDITWAADANLNGSADAWWSQMLWVAGLSVGGVSGWRLPKADVNHDGEVVDCSGGGISGCNDNEMGYLFWEEGVSYSNPGNFSNIQPGEFYWSDKVYNLLCSGWCFGNHVWATRFNDGVSAAPSELNTSYAWAVYPGDVANATMHCDLNNNNEIDAGDLSQVIRMALGQVTENLDCDLDNDGIGNGTISVSDIVVISRMALGLDPPIIN